ncbi:MAG: hypothetical protein AABX65_00855 [Nanoarchaeota archaeon]
MTIELTNLVIGLGIIILNLIPFIINEQKYFKITIPLSLLLAAIRVIFIK